MCGDDECMCCLILTLIISLIIGIPCLIYGCNESICPLQDCIPTMVDQDSSYNQDGFYHTQIQMPTQVPNAVCMVQTSKGFKKGNVIDICISSADGICRAYSIILYRLPIVACVFLSLAGLSLFLIIGMMFDCGVLLEYYCCNGPKCIDSPR